MNAVYLVEYDNRAVYDDSFVCTCGIYTTMERAKEYIEVQLSRWLGEISHIGDEHARYTIYNVLLDDGFDSLDDTRIVGVYECNRRRGE